MSTQIPPQVQNQLAQLQQVQQQAQSLTIQKSQMETLHKESELALEELENVSEDTVIYRTVGDLYIKADKIETINKLKEKIETLSLRIQSIGRQEERISKRFNQLQEQIQQAMGQQAE